MHRMSRLIRPTIALAAFLVLGVPAWAQENFGKAVDDVNKKMVKIFGTGGFKGLAAYGTGIVVSADGYILTVSSPMLDSQDVRVHLHDGRRFDHVKIVATEPELDLALLKIEKIDSLPFYDIEKAGKQPLSQTGDWVLAFSNCFQIATRNEPMSVQRGNVSSVSKLHGRRGINEAPYTGDVYFIDAITNNPGAGGGALTTRKGELIGIVGKELRNSLTDAWVNYAIPIQAKVEVPDKEKPTEKITVSVADFVRLGIAGKYKPIDKPKPPPGVYGYTGITMVPDVVKPRTPPFVEEVGKGSPAALAGLKPDDLVVYVDGELAVSVSTFLEIMTKVAPGNDVTLEVRRGDKLRTIKFKVEQPMKVAPK